MGWNRGSKTRVCGRCAHDGPAYNKDTEEVLENIDEKGAGAYCYQVKGTSEFVIGSVNPDRFDETKKFMEENLKEGKFLHEPFYLSRWNEATQRVELMLGQFPSDPAADPGEIHELEDAHFGPADFDSSAGVTT